MIREFNTVNSVEKTTIGAQRLDRCISYSVFILQLFNVFVLGDTRDNTVRSGEKNYSWSTESKKRY